MRPENVLRRVSRQRREAQRTPHVCPQQEPNPGMAQRTVPVEEDDGLRWRGTHRMRRRSVEADYRGAGRGVASASTSFNAHLIAPTIIACISGLSQVASTWPSVV